MSDASSLLSLADEQYVLLTTTRRSGVDVATAVWVARDGDELIVTTSGESGKVKRIRHTPRVTVQPCDRAGNPTPGTPVIVGHASIDTSDEGRARLDDIFREKYGAQYAAIRAMTKLRRSTPSVVVRIMEP